MHTSNAKIVYWQPLASSTCATCQHPFCVLLSILATERPSVGTALAASITTAITAGIASQRATIDGLVLERPCHELRRHLQRAGLKS